MYIHSKPASAILKLVIGALSLSLAWFLFGQYGFTALRLFPTWVLVIASVYFLVSSLIVTLKKGEYRGKTPCPLAEGAIIISFLLMAGMAIAAKIHVITLPALEPWLVWMIVYVLPVLTLLDWLLFSKKGRLKPMAPFYWLALPTTYAATMIFTAEMLPETAYLLYPLPLLNAREFDLWLMLESALLIAILMLVAGYILYLADFIMSGRLAKHIVLPHLKVVEVDEHGREIVATAPEDAQTTETTTETPKSTTTATPSTKAPEPTKATDTPTETPKPTKPADIPAKTPKSIKVTVAPVHEKQSSSPASVSKPKSSSPNNKPKTSKNKHHNKNKKPRADQPK